MTIIRNIDSFIISLCIIIAGILYSYELLHVTNPNYIIISGIIIIYNLITVIMNFVISLNHWYATLPKRFFVKEDVEPHVGIIIPTWTEQSSMVAKTISSIINQDYRIENLHIIVSDDAQNIDIRNAVELFKLQYPKLDIKYHVPPAKDNEERLGEGKAGNLNSALLLLLENDKIRYIETRDADDLVGSNQFLRETIGQLEYSPKTAFVQTIKTVQCSPNDPFANKELVFYKYLLVSKNSSSSVFPCGSGIVWRLEALLDIGGFPTWNLVEDFQSGAEASKKGWNSLYLPILGAIGQICPEDLPNYYKQRGIWAMDSMRLLLYFKKKGMSISQKLQYSESGLYYIYLAITFLYSFIPPSLLLLGISPLHGEIQSFFISYLFFNFALLMQQLTIMRAGKIQLIPFFSTIQMSFGLSPIYLQSLIKTLVYGSKRKPSYVVTRKSHKPDLYLHKVFFQIVIFSYSGFAIIYHVLNSKDFLSLDYINIFWSLFYMTLYSKIITLSWYKFNPFASGDNKAKQNLKGKLLNQNKSVNQLFKS